MARALADPLVRDQLRNVARDLNVVKNEKKTKKKPMRSPRNDFFSKLKVIFRIKKGRSAALVQKSKRQKNAASISRDYIGK